MAQSVYPGTDGSSNAVIPTNGGVQMLTTITGAEAPTRYDYKIDLPKGGRVELTPDSTGNGVVVFDGAGSPVFRIPRRQGR
jgi:hypothetical protein